ncbi:MAG: hypothetical protein KAU50_08795 [Candidatus Marinimicrobia bacterium]|nr:hypothetical protein [Candidatus Neomarinimicrobiota bacterium]
MLTDSVSGVAEAAINGVPSYETAKTFAITLRDVTTGTGIVSLLGKVSKGDAFEPLHDPAGVPITIDLSTITSTATEDKVRTVAITGPRFEALKAASTQAGDAFKMLVEI